LGSGNKQPKRRAKAKYLRIGYGRDHAKKITPAEGGHAGQNTLQQNLLINVGNAMAKKKLRRPTRCLDIQKTHPFTLTEFDDLTILCNLPPNLHEPHSKRWADVNVFKTKKPLLIHAL